MDALAEESTILASTQITENARRLLEERMMSARQITLEYREGVVFLRGQLPSFYQKQLAQETIRNLDGVEQIVNRIEVPRAT